MSASTCPVPTYECEFRIGQSVRIADPYAEEDPDRVFYVTAINWEYRTLPRWDITIASAEDIARGYGATDGFSPQDLIAVEPGHVILSPGEVRAMRDEGLEREPTGEMMDAVRHIIQWLQSPARPTEKDLFARCAVLRKPLPKGCREGIDHVPPARLIAYWIWTGMFDATAIRALKQQEPDNA